MLFTLAISFGCGEKEVPIIEPNISKDMIEFPFEEIENGKFTAIYRNNTEDSVPITLVMLSQNEVIKDSSNKDFCNEINAIRKGIALENVIPINLNLLVENENSVINQNDHPNLVSYSFPKGTYMILLMNSTSCNRDNYVTFDVKTNDGIEYAE